MLTISSCRVVAWTHRLGSLHRGRAAALLAVPLLWGSAVQADD